LWSILAAALVLAGAANRAGRADRLPGSPAYAYLPLACRGFELVPSATPTPTRDLTATLGVSKLVDLGEAPPDSVLHYTIVVMNDMLGGEDPGACVTLEDALPETLELVPGSLDPEAQYDAGARTIRWTGSIPRGGSIALEFQARMTPLATTMRSVSNTVVVTDAFGRVREAEAHTQVLLEPTATGTPATATPTHTPTPTSMPGPPVLYAPADGAVLPQPVAPNEWHFTWGARAGPCCCHISITGPGGRQLGASCIPFYPIMAYEYRYSTTEYLPDDALGPWHWAVAVVCPLGSNYSESRTFWVERAPARLAQGQAGSTSPAAPLALTPTPRAP